MSRANFAKLVRNIESAGRYEPLIVRPHPEDIGCFEIINGHHRCRALDRLGYDKADCVVWEIDDEQTDILLATLNRLGGSDELDKKLVLLERLNRRMASTRLAGLLPQTAKQIERLVSLKEPAPAAPPATAKAGCFANPMVFFVDDTQQQIIENALSLVEEPQEKMTKAARSAAALTCIARYFLNNSK